MSRSHKVIFIVGPTAVGKTDFAVEVAQKIQGSIMNCDSIQCYSHVTIGAAKPTELQRQKVKHFLFDWVHPPNQITAAEFRRQALLELPEQLKQGPVIIVGGSGFYVRALEKGFLNVAPVSKEISNKWQKLLDQEGSYYLHHLLRREDPEYSAKIHPKDGYRAFRALSLMESESRSMTQIARDSNQQNQWTFPTLKMGLTLSKSELLVLVKKRVHTMLELGLIEEVQSLLKEGLKDWPPLKSVGYKEVVEYLTSLTNPKNQDMDLTLNPEINLQGELFLQNELHNQIVKSTLSLIKKQNTWFQMDPNIKWFQAKKPDLLDAMEWINLNL
ncbi:MAG: tRNA (adenosine(37)-N6)-dimethylallyltransferase MiaA [Bdellovibrionales bacterium]|nr:tRNA (adenosine(37)-N6)-dimethylallyltransferase MiaA [Bdellovibrionales bacterium]